MDLPEADFCGATAQLLLAEKEGSSRFQGVSGRDDRHGCFDLLHDLDEFRRDIFLDGREEFLEPRRIQSVLKYLNDEFFRISLRGGQPHESRSFLP